MGKRDSQPHSPHLPRASRSATLASRCTYVLRSGIVCYVCTGSYVESEMQIRSNRVSSAKAVARRSARQHSYSSNTHHHCGPTYVCSVFHSLTLGLAPPHMPHTIAPRVSRGGAVPGHRPPPAHDRGAAVWIGGRCHAGTHAPMPACGAYHPRLCVRLLRRVARCRRARK